VNDSRQVVLIVLLVVVALAIGIATVVQTTLAVWGVVQLSDLSETVTDTLELFADSHIDAGFEDPVLRNDDPMIHDRRIFLGHDVNARAAKDVVVRLFHLNSLDPERPIDLYLSTQGGWIDNAFAIVDAMNLIDAPVNTWAVGGCYSAGALILVAGTGERYATDDAIIMVHASLADSSEDFTYDRLALARYEKVFLSNAQLPADWYPMTSDETYYLNADQALELQMIDHVVRTGHENGEGLPVEP
jgi:ATP-dependent Clp protease protease subunit